MKKTSNVACLISQVVDLVSARQLIFPFALLLIFTFNQNTLCAQMDVYQVNNSISTRFVSIRAAGSNNFIAIGETRSSDTLVNRALLVKLDLNYNVVWTRRSIAINTVDVELKDCYYEDGGTTTTNDDSYIVIGNVLSTPNKGFFWRVAASTGATIGNIMYYEHSSTTRLSYLNKLPNVGGGARYLITGRTQLTGGSSNLIAMCVNSTGAIQWQSTVDYPSATNPNADGRNNWGSDAVVSTDQNHLYVSGAANWLESIPPGSPNTYLVGEPYLLELSLTDGSIIKSRRYGPSQQGTYYDTYELLEAQDGNLIMVGRMSDGDFSDIRINKIDAISPTFDPIWANSYNFKATDDGYAASLSDDLVFITGVHNTGMPGNTNNDIMGLTIDMNGDINASKSLNYGTTTGNDKTGLNGGDVVNGIRLIAGSSTSFSDLFNNTNEAGLIIRHNLSTSWQPRQNICNELPATYNKGLQIYSQSLELRNVTSPVSSSSTPLLNAKGAITTKQSPNNCCPPIANFTYLQGSTTTIVNMSSFLAPGTYTGLSIQIDKRININGNYTFINCTFRMSSGAEIVIPNGKTMTIQQTSFSSACNKLWRGMIVNNGGILLLKEGAIIKDALYGVEMEAGSRVDVIGAVFTNNVIGIYKAYSTNNTLGFVDYRPGNVVFEKTSALLTPYTGILPTKIQNENADNPTTGAGVFITVPPTDAYAGVLISNSGSLNLSNSNCTFRNLLNGIVAIENLSVTVTGGNFQNIQSNSGALYGNGVYVAGYDGNISSLNVLTSTFNNCTRGVAVRRAKAEFVGKPYDAGIWSNTFNNNNVGITAVNVENTRLNIADNIINNPSAGSDVLMGINVALCKNSEVVIARNTITSTGKGIRLYNNSPFTCDIKDYNTINVANTSNAAYPTAISVQDASSATASNRVNITNNTINVGTNGHSGILGRSTYNLRILSNTINMTDQRLNLSSVPKGIVLEGVNTTRVNCNNINFGVGNPNQNEAHALSLSLNGNDDIKLSQNTFNNTRTGLWIQGSVINPMAIQGNSFGKHTWGLWLQDQASTGAQDYKANTWSSNLADYNSFSVGGAFPPAQVRHSGFLSSVQFCRFRTLTTVAASSGRTYTPTLFTMDAGVANTQWFNPLGTNTANSIWPSTDANWTGCGSVLRPAFTGLTQMEQSIMAGDIDKTLYEEAQNWAADKELYAKLLEVAQSGSPEAAFVDAKTQESEGKLYQAEKATFTELSLEESLKLTLTQNAEAIESLSALLYGLDTLLTEPNADIVTLTQQIEGLKSQIAAYYDTNKQLISDYESGRDLKADSIKTTLYSIVSNEVYEQNQKAVNEIYLSTFAKGNGDLDGTQIQLLADIANQCPLAGGAAVYAARAMYSSIENIAYNDEQLCQSVGYNWQEKEATINPEFSVSPNPNEGNMLLKMPIGDSTRDLVIYDVFGRIVSSQEIAPHTSNFNITLPDMPSGLYLLTILETENLMFSTKINIIK